jgi:peptidyl-prolyl cis-trans isomerase B (cyclophilin B)
MTMRKMMKMLLCLMMVLMLCPFALAEEEGLQQQLDTLDAQIAQMETELAELQRQRDETYVQLRLAQGATLVQMDIANYGTIIIELYPETAPITVANFVKLVNEGFYDGLTFHRIISGFMIQGGDPKGNGTGGSAQTIKGEFAQNGVDNPLKHERGVISMARSSMPDSASSQFFIMHEDAPHLDGSYAAFGRVLTGMEVVDAICATTPVVDYNGTVPNGYKPVMTSVRMLGAAE